jgi:hypothetical protein
MRFHMLRSAMPLRCATAALAVLAASSVWADKIKNPTAVFAGLDKITGRIIAFEAAVNETVQFGSLQITARVCNSRPEYENPQTTTFLEVEEVMNDNKLKRIFGGWMFAASPGLNAIEHPVYDVWLTDCKGGKTIIKTPAEQDEVEEVAAPVLADELKKAINPAQSSKREAPKVGPAGAPLRLPDAAPSGAPVAPAAPARPQQRFFPTNPGSGSYDPGPRG